jgi:hypothetical protein
VSDSDGTAQGDGSILVYPRRGVFRLRRPLARFDSAGVECAAGRVFWRDIESLVLVESQPDWHDITVWRLSFQLRAGTQPLPPSSDYYRGRGNGQVRVSDAALSLPLWSSARSALATVSLFYNGPLIDFLPHHTRRGWPGDDIGSLTDQLERERERKLKELFPESDGVP